jgi:hypothetical protein
MKLVSLVERQIVIPVEYLSQDILLVDSRLTVAPPSSVVLHAIGEFAVGIVPNIQPFVLNKIVQAVIFVYFYLAFLIVRLVPPLDDCGWSADLRFLFFCLGDLCLDRL